MRNPYRIVSVTVIAVASLFRILFAAELPNVTVDLANGRTLRARLDDRTSPEQLWLRFGTAETIIQRGFDWPSVASVRDENRLLSPQELVRIADTVRQPFADEPSRRIVIRSSESPPDVPSVTKRIEQANPVRVATVHFDAMLGNWDDDVAVDGLYVQLSPLDIDGQPVFARGVLTVELFSMQRVDQDAIAHGRGRNFGLVGRWTIPVTRELTGQSRWIRLPFQSIQPELDVDWAPFGLVHVQFVAPGHGVFHHSIDGLRTRPWAPLRDALQRQTGNRFFPSEMN